MSLLKEERVIIGGDLSFTLHRLEIWGDSTRVDILIDFFRHKIVQANIVDVEPLSLIPTWRNNGVGKAGFSKYLD